MPDDRRASSSAVQTALTTPRAAGYRMPAEYEPHDRCLMAWPTSTRRQVWGSFYAHAEASYAAVARAINGFEPVLMVVRPDDAAAARSYCGSDIEVVEMPIDDSWLRDSGPIFLLDDDRNLAATDFEFEFLGRQVCAVRPRRHRRRAPVPAPGRQTLERADGARRRQHYGRRRGHADHYRELLSCTPRGTRSCHKPTSSRCSRSTSGSRRSIWLKAGLGEDEDPDTDGHVDGVALFAGPGRVLLHMVRDRHHPDYENLAENRRRLGDPDARGRELEVVEFDLRSHPVDIGGTSIVENYINSYMANGAMIVPTGGTDGDLVALERLQEILPDRQVVGVPSPIIAFGGGGVHCIAQQVPSAGR